MICIFLNNKLISCDSILPVAMEVHRRSGRRALFITFDASTYAAIRRNVVLFDAINSIGRLILLGGGRGSLPARLVNHLRSALSLGWVSTQAILGLAHFLHFRALNVPPLAWLSRINRRRTYFCEGDSYGENQLMRDLTEVVHNRGLNRHPPLAGSLLAFQGDWHWLRHPATRIMPRFVFGPTRIRKSWITYVRQVAPRYHADLFWNSDVREDEDTIVFILGYLGALDYMQHPGATRRLFVSTLAALVEVAGNRPIILKPHVITEMSIVEAEVAKWRERGARLFIAHLHPSVLAVRAKVFVANYYSTTLADAFHLNVPTVEFTSYSDRALETTSGGSMRPDYVTHFINDDEAEFRRTIAVLLENPKRPLPDGISGDASGVLRRLSGIALQEDELSGVQPRQSSAGASGVMQ